jgi:ribose transport system ATP-binding protein
LARCGATIDIDRPLADATPVERTIVAVAAALQGWEGGRGLLVLDEPTAVLPRSEVSRLHEIVAELRKAGTSVLYVSHRLDEIFDICDRVTVLRQGRRIATGDLADLHMSDLTRLMAGEHVDTSTGARRTVSSDRPIVLEAKELQGRYLRGVSFSLREGEALGVCGLPGSGAEEIPFAISARGPRIPMVPADRVREGVIGEFTVAENLTLEVLSRVSRRTALSPTLESRLVRDWMDRCDIRAEGPGALVSTLSGGNQQKVVMSRCLATGSPVLVLCEPTAGVDIAARAAIHRLIREQLESGLSVLVQSADAGDLVALCTRVIVLRDGVVTHELQGSDITEASMVRAMEGSALPCP